MSSFDLQNRVPVSDDSPSARTREDAAREGALDLLKIAALVFLFGWYLFHPARFTAILDPDVWWHMRTGEWITQNGRLPHFDPFSITGAGKPWVAYSWTFEIAIYWITRTWDLLGLVAYNAFGYIALTSALFHLVYKSANRFWIAVVLTFVAALTFPLILLPRPGVLTTLLFILLLDVLVCARRSGSKRLLFVVPLFIWIWANVHVQFVYGLILIGAFCLATSLERKQAASYWLAFTASVALTFANPYGWGVYQVIVDFLRQPRLYRLVQETHPMSFDRMEPFIAMGLCAGAAVAITRLKQERLLWSMLLIWATASALRAERDIWVAVVVACAIIAICSSSVRRTPVSLRVWLAASACTLLLLVISFQKAPANKLLMARIAREYPVGAVAHIREHHLRGSIFNNFDWGGFLIYSLPQMPVAIDGRTNVHGAAEVERSLQTWNLQGDWRHDPRLMNANLVIASPKFPLTTALRTEPQFKTLFDDGTAVLFQRVHEDSE